MSSLGEEGGGLGPHETGTERYTIWTTFEISTITNRTASAEAAAAAPGGVSTESGEERRVG